MTTSHHDFNNLAALEADKPKYPPPFSLRLTYEERARLDELAGDKPLGAYIREQLLGQDARPRKRRGNSPVKDKEALGRVVGALGASRLSANLNQLAKAVNSGSLPVTPEVEAELKEACADVARMSGSGPPDEKEDRHEIDFSIRCSRVQSYRIAGLAPLCVPDARRYRR